MIIVIQLTKQQKILQVHLQSHWLNHSDETPLCNKVSSKQDYRKVGEERNLLRVWHYYC